MVFPGLMAMSVVMWIVGDLEVLQEQHLGPGTREHLHKVLALQTRRLFNPTSSLFPHVCLLWTSISSQHGEAKDLQWHGTKTVIRANGAERANIYIHIN